MATVPSTKVFEFTFQQGNLQSSSAVIEDGDAFSRLNLTPIIADKIFVQVGEEIKVYAAQWNLDFGVPETYEYDENDYTEFLQPAVDTPKARALRAAIGGNTGLTLASCVEYTSDFGHLLDFGNDDFVYLSGSVMNGSDVIKEWIDNLIQNVWNY